MAMRTPNGLNINLKPDYCFALMAKLEPWVNPYEMIKTAEGYHNLKHVILVIALPLLYFSGAGFVITGLSAFILLAAEALIERNLWIGLYVNPLTHFLVRAGFLYGRVSRLRISWLLFLLFGYREAGWTGAAIYLVALLMVLYALKYYTGSARPLSKNEAETLGINGITEKLARDDRDFLNAFLFHSRKKNRPVNLKVSFREMNADFWAGTYNRLAQDRPAVLRKLNGL